jgi:hypothetical protein
MIKSLISLLVASALMIAPLSAFAQSIDPARPNFSPGQMWSIKSAVPSPIRVIIGRVEPWNDKTAVHVSLTGVVIPAGFPGAGGQMGVGHLPFDQSALAASVDMLLATDATPDPNFESGYEQWRSAKGGIFTISVPEAVGLVFLGIARGRAGR